MRRIILALAVLTLPAVAPAQQPGPAHQHQMSQSGMPMNHAHMMQSGMGVGIHGGLSGATQAAGLPASPGQAAFGAIQEIVQMLEADPRTDWSKVDIDALRQHLIDMNNVTLAARVAAHPIDGGMEFVVTGDGAVPDSIRRMTAAHAATMDGVNGWHFAAKDTNGGTIFDVRVPPQDMAKLKGLGFIGVMTVGMHHQEHHLMIARGDHPHP